MFENSSANEKGEGDDRSAPYSYTEVFYKQFPYYLSIGMTEAQYWDADSTLVKYYREAEVLRTEKRNQEMWLQGLYVYDALSRLVPVLHAFAKKGTKAKPYLDKPYPVTKPEIEAAKKDKEKANAEKAKRYMQQLMAKSEIYYEERK